MDHKVVLRLFREIRESAKSPLGRKKAFFAPPGVPHTEAPKWNLEFEVQGTIDKRK